MASSWLAHEAIKAARQYLDYRDPLDDVLHAIQSVLILRVCQERNVAATAAAYTAHEAWVYREDGDAT